MKEPRILIIDDEKTICDAIRLILSESGYAVDACTSGERGLAALQEIAYDLLLGSDAKAEPPFAGYSEVRDAVAAAFNKILDGADIDATLRELDAEANEIHQEAAP